MKALIEAKADVNARTKRGDTPLILACSVYSPKVLEALIGAGADVNAANMQGQTALMAAAKKDGDLVELLLEAGADINAKDKDDKTALDYATENDDEKAVNILKSAADGTLPPAEQEEAEEEYPAFSFPKGRGCRMRVSGFWSCGIRRSSPTSRPGIPR